MPETLTPSERAKTVALAYLGDDLSKAEEIYRLTGLVQGAIEAALSEQCETIYGWLSPGEATSGAHLGDPCVYCGTRHDDVDIGTCPGVRPCCGDCGSPLQHVRPGKWQCPECE